MISSANLRQQLYSLTLPLFYSIFSLSTQSFLSILVNHPHRLRAILYSVNDDEKTKMLIISTSEREKCLTFLSRFLSVSDSKKFLSAWAWENISFDSFSEVRQQTRRPDLFVPWNSLTSTGTFIAELLKYHKRNHEESRESREEDEYGETVEEDDPELIKEQILKEVTKRFRLRRSSVSLQWNLSSIALLLLTLWKSETPFNFLSVFYLSTLTLLDTTHL